MYANGNKDANTNMTAEASKYPQKKFNDKPCRNCGQSFTPSGPSHHYCSQSCADDGWTDNYLKRTYDLSLSCYKKLLDKQDHKCAICGGEGFLMGKQHKNKLMVDHCHNTGEVRGLLCHNCNRALGLLKDSTESLGKAIKYLEGATTIRKEYTQVSGSAQPPEMG